MSLHDLQTDLNNFDRDSPRERKKYLAKLAGIAATATTAEIYLPTDGHIAAVVGIAAAALTTLRGPANRAAERDVLEDRIEVSRRDQILMDLLPRIEPDIEFGEGFELVKRELVHMQENLDLGRTGSEADGIHETFSDLDDREALLQDLHVYMFAEDYLGNLVEFKPTEVSRLCLAISAGSLFCDFDKGKSDPINDQFARFLEKLDEHLPIDQQNDTEVKADEGVPKSWMLYAQRVSSDWKLRGQLTKINRPIYDTL